MMLIFGLMLLLKTAACAERFCRFDQSGPCYADLGDKLNLLMVDTRNYDLMMQKISNENPLCSIKDDRMKERECDLFNNRPEVTVINGILIINPVIRADSGNYSVTVSKPIFLQVIVEGFSASLVHVLVWCCQMMLLLGLLGGFHIYMRLTSGKKQEDEEVRMRRFREGHEDQQQI